MNLTTHPERRKTMRILMSIVTLWLAAGAAFAQQDIAGTWSGKLTVAPGTSIEVHFVLTRGPSGYSAVLNSPDNPGIRNVPVNAVTFADNKLTLTVAALNGSFEGTLANGAFAGNWQQQGQSLPLTLAPYSAPVLTQADKERLAGSWLGTLSANGITVSIVYRFETLPSGEFVGFLDVPEQGARGIPLAEIQLSGNELKFKAPLAQMQYAATFDGQRMTGTWTQGIGFPLTMARGEYKVQVTPLNLPAATTQALTGSWEGTMTVPPTPGGASQTPTPVRVVFRFATNAAGQFEGFVSTPDRGAAEIPFSSADLVDGKVVIKHAGTGLTYTSTLSGNTLAGDWMQTGLAAPLPLTLTKK